MDAAVCAGVRQRCGAEPDPHDAATSELLSRGSSRPLAETYQLTWHASAECASARLGWRAVPVILVICALGHPSGSLPRMLCVLH